ncbi:hypothetical protein [uncultured Aquimarina sp.]|uniref:hypothetical protein n=1 Tax=uncultured Aquimarina sp. TaxID=575652 RepID=UPI0026131241|nr:hypothetical protein [uncultured Aquimarina sp.]
MDIKAIIKENPKTIENKYYAPIWSYVEKGLNLKWFNFFDAIVFISKGELAT